MMPADSACRRRALPPDTHDEGGEVAGHCQRERPPHHRQDICRFGRGQIGRDHRHHEQQHAGYREPTNRRRLRVEHLVVDIVAERVGDGEQEPVGGRERRRKAAGRHQARDHIGKSRDLRGGEHDHVRVDHEVLQPHHTRMTGNRLTSSDGGVQTGGILAADLDQAEFAPGKQPRPNSRNVPADDVGVDLQLRERRIGRRREVQQEDEEQ